MTVKRFGVTATTAWLFWFLSFALYSSSLVGGNGMVAGLRLYPGESQTLLALVGTEKKSDTFGTAKRVICPV